MTCNKYKLDRLGCVARLRVSLLLIATLVISSGAFVPPTTVAPSRPSFPLSTHSTRQIGHSYWRRTRLARRTPKDNKRETGYSTTSRLFLTAKSEGKKRLALGMAFMTGWADVFLLLKFETFATMMTGNAMKMALALVESQYRNVAYFASVIVSYVLGLAAFRRTDLTLKEKTLGASAFVVAGLFIGADVCYATTGGARWIPIMLLSLAFGIINSVGTEVAGTLTFVVTGHMTKLTNQVVDRWSRTAGRKPLTAQAKLAAVENSAVLFGFFGGALFAGFLASRGLVHKSGIFSVMGILYGLLFLWQDMEALGGAWWKRKGGDFCDVDDDGEVCLDDEEGESDVAGD